MDLPLCSPLRLFGIVALSAMCLPASSGLVTAEEAAQPAEKPEPAFKYDPEFPDSMVVATVNSEPITAGEVLAPYKHYLETEVKGTLTGTKGADERANALLPPGYEIELNMEVYPLPARYFEIRREWVKRFLADVVDRKLRVQGLTSDLTKEQRQALDVYLDEHWDLFTVELRRNRGISTIEELAGKMKKEKTDLATVKHHWREGSMAHQFKLLKVESRYEPTSQDLQDYYERHEANWFVPTRVRWQQIVVRRQNREGPTLSRKRAQQLLEKLRGGADFSTLARAQSEGATKSRGGIWDWTETDSLACQELGEFLAAGKVGSISEVISYKDEFHIARILEREDARRKSFEEVEAEIRDILKMADRDTQARKAVRERADKSVIKTVFGNDWKFEVPTPEDSSKAG